MSDPEREASRWLDQAANDIVFARHALTGEFFHQVCFICQQAAEKALKAMIYHDGARNVIGHSAVALITRIVAHHPRFEAFREHAAELDLFYIATRYPNGLVEGTPHEAFTRGQAERALERAEAIVNAVRRATGDGT